MTINWSACVGQHAFMSRTRRGALAGKSSKGSKRLLVLKGNLWWFRRQVPAKARWANNGKSFLMVPLQTSDVIEAKAKRDELETLTSLQFRQVVSGTRKALELPGIGVQKATSTPASRGALNREALVLALGEEEEELISYAAEHERDALKPSHRAAFDDAFAGRVDVDHYLDAYISTADLAPKTKKERKGLIGRFATWCRDKDVKLTHVDRKMAGKYVSEVIDDMHPATQRKHLTALKKYWSFLARRGHVDVPAGEKLEGGWPWNGQQTERRGKRAERGGRVRERPYTEEEVRLLLFAEFPLRPEWQPLMMDVLKISLLSGMREAEIITLWAEEVYQTEQGWVFDLQQGKNTSAARRVPVHSALTEIVQERLKDKSGKDWLFDECRAMKDPSDTFGKRFKRWREAVGVDDKRDGIRRSLVNFHSARRWFATEADLAGIRAPVIRDVIGHVPDKNDTLRAAYIAGTPEEQMRACVEAVRLPRPSTTSTARFSV